MYFKFDETDVLNYVLNTSPNYTFASGVAGWRGSVGTSGSISLYSGIRSRQNTQLTVQPRIYLNSYSVDGNIVISGSYPLTSSIKYINVLNREISNPSNINKENWGREHFYPILNLYNYYSKCDVDYVTSSYDYYCLFSSHANNGANYVKYSYTSGSSKFDSMSGSYTVEAMIKPFSVTGSDQYTICGRHNLWRFYVDGPTGKLAFSASDGVGVLYTSSFGPTLKQWSHVCFRYGSGQANFTINMVDAGNITSNGALKVGSSANVEHFYVASTGSKAFYGLMFETKLWSTKRTFDQLSSSFNATVVNSSSADLIHYSRFNDGPLYTGHGFSAGSGALDHSNSPIHGQFVSFADSGRESIVWLPNDNTSFTTFKQLRNETLNFFKVIDIPSLFYGRQIATGSVAITCNSFLSSSIMRTLVDDGRGNLYMSGSNCSGTISERDSFNSVKWNKVGNVFYSEGLIVIKDPSLFNFAETTTDPNMPNDLLQISFSGVSRIPTKTFMCRVGSGQANCSNNKTYYTLNANTGNKEVVRDENDVYITSVGLYDKDRKLVGVAKLAHPIRKREADKINFKIKMDF